MSIQAAVRYLTYMIYLHVISVMTWGMLTLTDYWTWFRTIMGVNLMGLGSRLLFIINYSVLDAKLFYLSLQQHLNQLQTAVEDLTYMMYQYKFNMNYKSKHIVCIGILLIYYIVRLYRFS